MKHKCLLCGAALSGAALSLPGMPAGAQAMPSEAELGEDRGLTLSLTRCPVCGLTQFDCEPVAYFREAIRVVGLSETMRELRRADYRHLIGHYGAGGKKWLECGCSNGDFLEVLTEFDADIYGTEAGEAGLAEAGSKLRGRVPEDHLMRLFPDREEMEIPGAPFDVFLSFNFLEHQPDPVSMLRCIRRNLKEDGIGLITVPSFEYILQKGRYYELIRDHIANYDMASLERLCMRCGFEVLEKDLIGIGDTLRVIVRKMPEAESCSGKAPCGARKDISETAAHRNDEAKIAGIGILEQDYRQMREGIAQFVRAMKKEGKTAALWGAGHQGFTIASTTELGSYAKYIIDSSPKKQGRYAPASHLRIVPPEEYLRDPVDMIIVSAPGYVREISAQIRERFKEAPAGVPGIRSILELE